MREKTERIIKLIEAEYPHVKGSTLNWEKPLDILVATILSAQSTDAKVNEITINLFKKYPTAED